MIFQHFKKKICNFISVGNPYTNAEYKALPYPQQIMREIETERGGEGEQQKRKRGKKGDRYRERDINWYPIWQSISEFSQADLQMADTTQCHKPIQSLYFKTFKVGRTCLSLSETSRTEVHLYAMKRQQGGLQWKQEVIIHIFKKLISLQKVLQ